MSFCRFSTDDFRCDVYVYRSHAGYEINVASSRYEFDEPLPPPVDMHDAAAYLDRSIEVQRIVRESSRSVPIGLPFDGRSFGVSTAAECVTELERLRDEGYRVPERAIAAIRNEAAEEQLA